MLPKLLNIRIGAGKNGAGARTDWGPKWLHIFNGELKAIWMRLVTASDKFLKVAGGVLKLDAVQKIQILSWCRNMSETTPIMATWLYFECLNHS